MKLTVQKKYVRSGNGHQTVADESLPAVDVGIPSISYNSGLRYSQQRRKFLKNTVKLAYGGALAVAGAAVAPYVNALPDIVVPQISQNPSVGELVSRADDVWKEMYFVDLTPDPAYPQSSSSSGKFGIGFDKNGEYMNVIFDYLSERQKRHSEITNFAIDKTNTKAQHPQTDTYIIVYRWEALSDFKIGLLYQGNGSKFTPDTPTRTLPPELDIWQPAFQTSPFDRQNAHAIFAGKILSSFLGPGGSGGKYGIYASLGTGDASSALSLLKYPSSGDENVPATYDTVTTQYPIPEFTDSVVAFSLPIVLSLGLLRFRANRMRKQPSKHVSNF